MKYLLFFILISSAVYAQYSQNDNELVKTTFSKEFDASIISKYLNSSNDQTVIAGLLSVAHSKDTTYVKIITELNYEKFGRYIAFALGQIGYSFGSMSYLKNNIFTGKSKLFTADLLEAYGKIGNKDDCSLLIEKLNNENHFYMGYPYALYNFHQRGFIENYDEVISLLTKDLNSEDEQILFDALFGLQRINNNLEAARKVGDLIQQHMNEMSIRCLSYSLSGLRRINDFHLLQDTYNRLLNHSDWRVRCEAVRKYAGYPFKTYEEINSFFALLTDSNRNVARQTAISLKELILTEDLKNYVKSEVIKYLDDHSLTESAKGELFISYCTLFPNEIKTIIEKYDGVMDDKYLLAVIGNNENANWAFRYLNNKLEHASLQNEMTLVEALLSYQESLLNNKSFSELVLKELRRDEGTIVSLMSFALDSIFVSNNLKEIEEIIKYHFTKNLNNGFFTEGLTSLYTLAEQHNKEFASYLLDELSKSDYDDLKRFYFAKKAVEDIYKSTEYFDKLWAKSFEYDSAKVFTNRGNFVITFLPGVAPISVGNFCYLAEKSYFDKVIFHRVIPDFVAQTGDPTGTGWGGPGYSIDSEFSPIPIAECYVGMASSGQDTEGSQWYVLHNDFPHLYGRYTMFGNVTEGMDELNNIDQGSYIIKIELNK